MTDTFTVRVTDDKGGYAEQLVTIQITGTNDAPVISYAAGNDAGSVQEDGPLTASGTLTSSDIDHGATAAWSIAGPAAGDHGTLSLDGNTGKWTYTLANGTAGTAGAVQSLAAGETVTDTFTVRVTDDKGGYAEQLVTIQITGTNDAPVISYAAGNDAGSVQEDGPLTASGTLTSSDIDHGATAAWSIAGPAAGDHGTLSLDGNTGKWTYTLANGTAGTAGAVQSLAAGETVKDTFTVRVTDDKGGYAEQLVTIQITGTNDAPVISYAAGNDAGSVQEDGPLTASGTLTSSDIDHGATAAWSIAGPAAGDHGTLSLDGNTGKWTYTLANGTAGTAGAVQSLAAGETVTDTFTVRVTDDKGGYAEQLVTIQITGTNDAPVIDLDASAAGSGYASTFVDTGVPVSIAGINVSITDPDNANMAAATITLTNAKAGDILAINGSLPEGISASMNSSTVGLIKVTLTGSATKADYDAAIHQVVFSTTPNPDTRDRIIAVVTTDGLANSNVATSVIHVSTQPRRLHRPLLIWMRRTIPASSAPTTSPRTHRR